MLFPSLTIAVYWIYSAWFESSGYMATPGKRSVRIMVTSMQGHRISFLRAAQRIFFKNMVLYLLSLPGDIFLRLLGAGYYFLDISAMFKNNKKQCLHDHFAGTIVVHGKADPIDKATSRKALLFGIAMASSILLVTLLSIIVYASIAPAETSEKPPLVIDGYTIGNVNLEDSQGLTVSEKLAAINLSIESGIVREYSRIVDPDYSERYVGEVKPSSVKQVEGNTYFTWPYTNLNSGLLSTSTRIVNVPVNYLRPHSNTPLRMLLFVDLTNNRILGYERVKNPDTTYIRVTKVCYYIHARSGWYHELRGNYESYSSSEIKGTFYRVGFKLECSPDDFHYLFPFILDTGMPCNLKED